MQLVIVARGSQGSRLWRLDSSWQRAEPIIYDISGSANVGRPLPDKRPALRQQSKSNDEYPDRRDFAPAYLCDHFASGRRQDHIDREIAAVWRGDPIGGRSQGARRRVRSDWMAVER